MIAYLLLDSIYYHLSYSFPPQKRDCRKEIKTCSQAGERKIKCNISQIFEKVRYLRYRLLKSLQLSRTTQNLITATASFLMHFWWFEIIYAMVGLLTRCPKSQRATRLPKYLHSLQSIEKRTVSLSRASV